MQAGHKSAISSGQVSGAGARPALSETERGILDFIVLFLRSNTYQPSIREIGRHFGIKSTKTVSEHLQALADKGYIERDPSRSRGVRIFGVDLHAESVSLPLFDDLQAAMPGRRSRRPATHITLDRQLAGGSGGFIVRAPARLVRGGAIARDDYLVIAPVTADELTDGELIVAHVGGTADYFRVRRDRTEVLLQPLLGEGVPARMGEPASLVLVGRVAGLYRRVGPEPSAEPATAH